MIRTFLKYYLMFQVTGGLDSFEKSSSDRPSIYLRARVRLAYIYKKGSPVCPVNLQVKVVPVLKIDIASNTGLYSPLLLENINQTMGKNQIFDQPLWR